MLLKKLIVYSISFIVLAFSASAASAQTTATPAAIPATVSPISPLYTDLLLNNMMHTFSCFIVGQSFIQQPCLTYKTIQNPQGTAQNVPVLSRITPDGGVLGTAGSLLGALYLNPPVRTADYLASVGKDIGVIKTANAQIIGSGATILNPVLRLWQTSRNIAYVFMIIIFLIIGLMIIFRNKINPQTVISAQAALPGLIIGLVMITFSYFFAGLISDMAFVGTNIVGYYFTAAQGNLADLNLSSRLSDTSIMDLMAPMTGIVTRENAEGIAQSVTDKMGDAIKPVQIVIFWLVSQFLMPLSGVIPPPGGLIAGPIVSLFGGFTANLLLPQLLGYFLSFAAALALTYQMIKLLVRLIMAYLTIIFLTISAPFQFLIASLPGRQGMATGWMMNMLGNILVFPAVIAVIYFVAFILGPDLGDHCPKDADKNCFFKVPTAQLNNGGFISPAFAASPNDIIGNTTFPLLGGLDFRFVKILLAFGALMALPTIPDLVTKSIGKAGQAGQAIGHEIMGGFGQGQGYAKRTYMGAIGYGQQANTMIRGEKGLVYDPSLHKYVTGISRPGYGDWRAAKIAEAEAAAEAAKKKGYQ